MARIEYKAFNFKERSITMIAVMNGIIASYQQQGYTLTVRQLYYQLVARDVIENTIQSYKNIAGLVNDARLAGMMDWNAIEDRTREFIRRPRWESGQSILNSVAQQFHMDMWENQASRVFVIVEKEALVGVLERTCREFDVPLLAARGYPSASVLHDFCTDQIEPCLDAGQDVVIFHLGDHDPSGLDMTRDIEDRIALFTSEADVEVHRIALNMDQVDELKPPPNPAKSTDCRYKNYRRKFGTNSWELDALTPNYLNTLLRGNIESCIHPDRWDERKEHIDDIRSKLSTVAEEFGE